MGAATSGSPGNPYSGSGVLAVRANRGGLDLHTGFMKYPGLIGQLSVIDAVKALVGGRRLQSAQLLYVGAELQVVETAERAAVGKVAFARIPGRFHFSVAHGVHITCQPVYFVRIGIAAHKADAGNGSAVCFEQGIEGTFGEPFARVLLQMGAVAPFAAIRTVGEIDGQCYLVGHLLKYDVITLKPQHNDVWRPPFAGFPKSY